MPHLKFLGGVKKRATSAFLQRSDSIIRPRDNREVILPSDIFLLSVIPGLLRFPPEVTGPLEISCSLGQGLIARAKPSRNAAACDRDPAPHSKALKRDASSSVVHSPDSVLLAASVNAPVPYHTYGE
ncbi:MAG: hypothetical protein ACLFVS_05475 [Candidatus Acetothermia bacterium]